MVLGFVAFAYLARTLPVESYGIVEYAVGLAALAAIVIEAGLGPIGARGISRDRTSAASLAARIPAARLLLAALVVPLVGMSGWAAGLAPGDARLVWLYALSLLAIPFKQDWLLQGLERMERVAPAQALKSATFVLGLLWLVRDPADVLRVGAIEIAAAAVMAAYYLAVQRSLRVPVRIRPGAGTLTLLRSGAAVGASNIVWTFMLYAPIFLVTNMVNAGEAAWLGSAQRIVYSMVGFSALYFFNIYPAIARGLHEDRPAWERLMGSSYRVVAWGSLGLALAITLAADRLVVLAFGDAFLGAAPVLAIYVWLLPIRLLSGHARWTLVAGERQDLLLWSEGLAAAALVVSCALLVPVYGSVGAAISVVVGNSVGWLAVEVFAGRRVSRVPGLGSIVGPTGVALGGALAVWILGDTVRHVAWLAMGAYAGAALLGAKGLVADVRRLAYAKDAPDPP
jgi:O-antigen/teichoic acid export membrane protein